MKTPRFLLPLVLAAALATGVPAATAPVDTPELLAARAELVEAYKRGEREDNNNVKQLRAKITALEFIAQNSTTATTSTQRVVSVDFPGGPFSTLLAAANRDGANFNVVGEKADLAVELPAFAVRNADTGAFATALDNLLSKRGYRLEQSSRAPSAGQAAVYVLRKRLETEDAYGRVVYNSRIQAFQLQPYLAMQNVDAIIGAIRVGWALDPANNPEALRLQFHPPTSILVVSGSPEAITLTQQILGQLVRDPATPKNPVPPANQPASK